MCSKILWIGVLSFFALVNSLPTSLVEDVKANEIKDNKVKRAHSEIEENPRNPVSYYSGPTAIKRGSTHSLGSWNDQKEALAEYSPLYTSDEGAFTDKSALDYDKGYRYVTNKEKLDEALENVLNSDLFSDPSILNQYRYYDGNIEERRRKRRANKSIRLNNRFKREIELTPEEILTLLSIWENERHRALTPEDYRPLVWAHYDLPNSNDDNEIDQDDEWLDSPVVYPHVNNQNRNEFVRGTPNYIYDDKKGQWNGFSENKRKRFMVAKKRNDPTRELRYLNGPPQKNDFYTLSQLLSAQHEPNAPLYHRMVL